MSSQSVVPIPALLALASAFLIALSYHVQALGLAKINPQFGAVVSITSGTLVLWLFSPLFVEGWYWWTAAALLFGLVGIFRPALSMTLQYMGIKYMGPTLTSALSSTTPLFAAILAVAVLGEMVSLPIAVGTAAIIAGVVVSARKTEGVVQNWPFWAVGLPVGAACIRASAHTITKFGLEEVESAFFATLVGNSVSAVVALASYCWRGGAFPKAPADYRWFVLAGLISAAALLSLNQALKLGTVILVAPITSAFPVFTLLLGLLVFRSETISWRTVLTIGLIVPGVFLVILG